MEWEAMRVASAFGMEECNYCFSIPQRFVEHLEGRHTDVLFEWAVSEEGIQYVFMAWDGGYTRLWIEGNVVASLEIEGSQYNELMVRGLYRLGIEDEDTLAALNSSLTAHEKLELRLYLSREFWPKQWLDEEAAKSLSVAAFSVEVMG